jgi:hypothetical protein
MKTIMSISMLVISIAVSARQGKNPYAENMVIARHMMDTATLEKTYVTAAGYFQRIAAMNPDQWLPHYYAAFCFTRTSHLNTNSDIQDQWVDKAEAEIDKALSMEPYNSEVLVMKGFVLQARMNINPMVRGFQYYGETMSFFDKARAIDPENPRSYLWQGVNLLHTPEAFGGGKEKGCPLITRALEKYESFMPADSLAPNWGYSYAREMEENCK